MNHRFRALETKVKNLDFTLILKGINRRVLNRGEHLVYILKESLWVLCGEWIMAVRTEMEKKGSCNILGDESSLDEGSSNGAGDKWTD